MMKQKTLLVLFSFSLIVGCTPQKDFFEAPVPATMVFGQKEVDTETTWVKAESLEFGRKPFGSTSKNIIHVKNVGTLPGKIHRIWVSGENAEHFQVQQRCDTLAQEQDCAFTVSYSPETVGATPATLNVSYDTGTGSSATSELKLNATASNLAFLKFEKDVLDIKTNTIGYTLSSYFKVIYNGSALAGRGLQIEPAKGIMISDPVNSVFKIDRNNSTCGDVIQSDCIIKVDFSPTAIGLASTSFSVNYFNGAEVLKLNAAATGTGLAATVLAELNASTADFGNVVVNPLTPAGLSVPIVFSGSVAADNVVIKGPTNAAFSIDTDKSKTTCGNQIAGTCALYLKFNPTALGSSSSQITIEYNSNGQARTPLKFTVQGKGVNPALINSDVQSLAFGSNPAFKTITKKFTLTNSGDVAISQLSALTLSDTNNFSGSFESKCATLAASNTCALNINFRAKSAAAFTGKATFTYFNGRETKKIELDLSGTGTSPLALEGSRTIDFGNVMIGSPTLPAAINSTISIYGTNTLTNASQLVLNPTALKTPFGFTTTVCQAPLDPKKSNSCVFGVALKSNTGMAADTAVTEAFTMAYTGDNNEGSGSLSFTAKVTPRIPPTLNFSAAPTIATISVDNSTTATVTIKNNSPYFATTSKGISLTGSSNFSIQSNACSGGLTANASCAIVVKFAPTSSGPFTTKLKYVYNDQIQDKEITVDLNASASENVTLVASATTIDFGSVFVGDVITPKTISLKYYGEENFTNTIAVSAPFSVTAVNCGEAKKDCSLTIEYNPTASGNHSTTATFTYSPALVTPGQIKLTLKGVASTRAPVLSISPSTLAKTVIGSQSTQTLTIKNTGNTISEGTTLPELSSGVLTYAADGAPGSSGHCATGVNLKAGESCTVKVVYAPIVVGKQDMNFPITYGAVGSKLPTTLKLSMTGTQMIQVYSGGFQTCIINELGKVICWGRNSSGQLGQGTKLPITTKPMSIPAIDFDDKVTIKKLAVGDSHTCAILNNPEAAGQVVCWGSNENGRLGIGDLTSFYPSPSNNNMLNSVNLGSDDNGERNVAIDVAAGFEHTCALLATGDVKCWGGNTSGQLGTESRASIGITKLQMTNLKPINLGRKAVSISAGAGHSCAVLDNGSTKCWGDNFYGQLGSGTDKEKIGMNDGDMGSLHEILLGSSFSAKNIVASNGAFTCALSKTGDIKCFGKTVTNESTSTPFYGVLGNCWARAAQNSQAVNCSGSALVPTNSIGYRSSDMGEALGKVDLKNFNVKQLTAGTSFSCALSVDGDVKCWGLNDQGQLGAGNTTNVGDSSNLASNAKIAISNAVQIASGYDHSCAVLENNTLKCWGTSFQNATGLTSLGVSGSTGATSSTLPSTLPVVYDGR